MHLNIPELSLVLLVGPSGCGKSTFAAQHFLPTEVVSSDRCRALVSDDETDQTATTDAFEVLHTIAGRRLERGRLTVVDATNVQDRARKPLIELARRHYVLPVAIVFDLPESVCQERNRLRTDREIGPHVIRNQKNDLRRSLSRLQGEGIRQVHILRTPEEVASVVLDRRPLWPNRKHETGPFDVIGDVHGCADELEELLALLGYQTDPDGWTWRHPAGRRAIFLGDLVDRGPRTPDVLRIAMAMTAAGTALCVPGNHDDKLKRALQGKRVQIRHGLEQSMEQLEKETPEFRETALRFLDGLVSHYVLDGGRLVVAHGGLKERMQGRASGQVRDFALYGETTGETDEFGLPVRADWAARYRGSAMVVYGHTPVYEPEWVNRTINIDTGCVFGGRLTALRYPENELVSVPARQAYAASRRPFLGEEKGLSAQQRLDEVLDLEDVLGQRTITTRFGPNVTIREANALAALEVMSRFAANPKWIIYLPPTMSPSETADPQQHPDLLEHPAQAFAYYRHRGVGRVVCEEKHMGSRAVVVICRDEEAARRRFGVIGEGNGVCYTRTGRPFFADTPAGQELERGMLDLLRGALDRSGFWDKLGTDWACFDCELMPWSAKARELIRHQYAAVAAAARGALPEAVSTLERAAGRGIPEAEGLLARFRERQVLASRYAEAWNRYCWPVTSVADLRLAPFHLLATEGAVHADKDHLWHLNVLAEVCAAEPGLLLATRHQMVDLTDPESEAAATRWWEEMTAAGGEGMVVKPVSFLARGQRGLLQPALKCRGREYLRIIYGPEYTLPENLDRLRARGLSVKRSLALREFALGLEALERFVHREPLRKVHECVFGVLALESEPVDPRL